MPEPSDAVGTLHLHNPAGECVLSIPATPDRELRVRHMELEGTDEDLSHRCFDTSLRPERIIHLDTMLTGDHPDSDLIDELLEDDQTAFAALCESAGITEEQGEEFLNQYGPAEPVKGDDESDEDYQRRRVRYRRQREQGRSEAFQEFVQWVVKGGWFVHAARPHMEPLGHGASVHYGQMHVRWFHGRSFEAAMEKALEWASEAQDAAMAHARQG